ncbi:MAG: PLP-dependent aminotransferase family protein [Cohaesibacteraceae bacterium]|nr:PLP-dependent aminotransferase family protein [Cohaesibacteraceae bacterium]MBL4876937.1 PLP-dependent aminotransferase family protein [Cohaesibacteraceae bacterium]
MAQQQSAHPERRQHIYEQVAGFITDQIDSGVLRPAMRAPSLRSIATQHKIAMSTALQAYQLLEDRGVLEARPRSGYYVTSLSRISLPVPHKSQPPKQAKDVTLGARALQILKHASDMHYAPLGCAIPAPQLLAAGPLDRHLSRTARVHGAELNIYTEVRGMQNLRDELARRAMFQGQIISPDDILITSGCTEALALALKAVTKPGDVVAIESPTYFGLLQILQSQGLKVLELPTDASTGIDIKALQTALKSGTINACLFTSSFNNPLGCAMDDNKKLQILDLLEKHQVPLIEDDIYGDLYFGSQRPKPFLALRPDADVILCSSFSKTIAPGYRIGWLTSKHRMPKILEAKFAISLCGPPLLQVAMAEYLKTGGYDAHLRRMRRAFAQNIDATRRAIDKYFPKSTRLSCPAGGFVLWLELPTGCDATLLYEQAKHRMICISPGNVFTTSDRYQNCIRISCGHSWDDRLDRAVKTLGDLVKQMV